jgi:KUP system potassium uptake protein
MTIQAAGQRSRSGAALILGSIGVVYGDIGTSPLYAIKQCFAGVSTLSVDRPHVLAVLSLIFWAVTIVVSFKYITVVMRADNRGEGGSLALLALISRAVPGGSRPAMLMAVAGIFAAALFYGDSVITPSISVLSAVEGLEVAAPGLQHLVVPATVVILVCLFLIQRRGTGAVGALFGPIMCLWFAVLAVTGLVNLVAQPGVLLALDPRWALGFVLTNGWQAVFTLGSVVLAVTGAEALYTDMGHFGRGPIRRSWFAVVLPALTLNYFGQGALLLTSPAALNNPFYHLVPAWGVVPLIGLATLATIIASQAVISGAFSMTQQAIQLGLLPRMAIVHTSAHEIGQIYIPFVNWVLLALVGGLVIGFGSSEGLAAAYGVAVTGTMTIDSLLISVVIFVIWRWHRLAAVALALFLVSFDLSLFLANATKIPHGGWFPLAVGLVVFVLLTTWKRGRALLAETLRRDSMPLELFLESMYSSRLHRVPGTAIFMTGSTDMVPQALLHNLKHNMVLHERNALLTVKIETEPYVPDDRRLEVEKLADGLYRAILRYGFMDQIDVPAALARFGPAWDFPIEIMRTSFFFSRETIIASRKPGMAPWREHIFAWMSRSATSAMVFFGIPTNRVIELGAQIEI